jgi:hypothetical protein
MKEEKCRRRQNLLAIADLTIEVAHLRTIITDP